MSTDDRAPDGRGLPAHPGAPLEGLSDAGRAVARLLSDEPCPDCNCCALSACHTGPNSGCPTSRFGDFVCPCTEPIDGAVL